ncbi:uncharacterized protein METZ01_LOCUS4686, partial [marine metagenome]
VAYILINVNITVFVVLGLIGPNPIVVETFTE